LDAALILSRFDPLYGPKILLKAPQSLEEGLVSKIPSLMEVPTSFRELKQAVYLISNNRKYI
jgi:hypothetical protein